jgi:NDP-sugar pyrophosphorylase family protein
VTDTSDPKSQQTLVVMAAGMGSRFGGLKQLAPVGPAGEAMFDYSAADAVAVGFRKAVVIVRKEIADQIQDHIATAWPSELSVEYVYQEVPPGRTKPLGTAEAVLTTKDHVQGPFTVLNADDLYGADAFRVAFNQLAAPSDDHVLVGYHVNKTVMGPGTVTRGLITVDDHGYLASVDESSVDVADGGAMSAGGRPLIGEELASTNFWGFRPTIFAVLEDAVNAFLSSEGKAGSEVLLPVVVGDAVNTGRVRVQVVPTDARMLGITHADDLERVRRELV